MEMGDEGFDNNVEFKIKFRNLHTSTSLLSSGMLYVRNQGKSEWIVGWLKTDHKKTHFFFIQKKIAMQNQN